MKLRYIVLLIFISIGHCAAQNKELLDSLKNAFPSAESKVKMKLLARLSRIYSRTSPDTGIYFGNILRQEAEKINDLQMLTESYSLMGMSQDFKGNLDSAAALHKKALKIRRETKDTEGIMKSLVLLGIVYEKKFRYKEAMEMNIEAARLAESNKNAFYTGLCFNNIGNILVAQNRHTDGLKYYKKALVVKQQNNDPSIGIVYNNIGAVWQNLEQMDSAEYYFNIAVPLRRQAQDEFGVIATQRNLAVVYEFQRKWPKALSIYREILPKIIAYEVTDYEAVSYFHIGHIYLKMGRLDSARYYMNWGRVLADSVEAYSVLQEGYGFLAKLDSSQNNFRQSFEWLKLKMEVADTITVREKDKALTDMRVRYETDMAEQENTVLKQEKQILTQEIAIDKLWKYGLAIGLLLLSFLAFTFYKNAQLSKINLAQSKQIFDIEKEKLYENQLLLEAQNAVKERENQLLQEKVSSQNRELTSLTLQTVARNELLTEIKEQIVTIKDEPNKRAISHQIDQVLGSDDDWKQFLTHFNAVNPNFLITLQEQYPDLSGGELKLCAYLRMNLSTKEIALLQNIEADSVFKARKRLRKKLNIADSDVDLTAFLQAV